MKKVSVQVFLLIVLMANLAMAREHSLPKLKLKVNIPDSWQVETQGDLLTAIPQKEDLALIFFEAKGEEHLNDYIEKLDSELDKFVSDAEPDGEPVTTKINGMDALLVDGKGKAEGKPVEFSVGLIDAGKGKILLMLGFAEPKAAKNYESQLTSILKSIKKS